jgi:hypothetical protein
MAIVAFTCCFMLITTSVLLFVFAPYTQSRSLSVADFEQYVLQPKGVFYSGVTVDSVGLPALTTVALFADAPTTVTAPARTELQSLTIPYDQHVFYAYQLMKDSTVQVVWNLSASTVNSIDFFVIVGEARFDDWANGESVSEFYKAVGRFGSFEYTFTAHDDVYFVFENSRNSQVLGAANFTVTSVQFDLDSAKPLQVCRVYPCTFDPMQPGQLVIVNGLENQAMPNTMRTVAYRVLGRLGFFFSIVGGVIGAVAFLVLTGCAAIKFKSRRSRYTKVENYEPPSQPSPAIVPYQAPSYETPTGPVPPPLPATSPEFSDGPAPSAPLI